MNCKSGDPRGICVDQKDNILVADKTGNSVSLYSSDGVHLRVLLSQSDGIFEPRQLAAVDHKTLAVVDASNTIKLFTFNLKQNF